MFEAFTQQREKARRALLNKRKGKGRWREREGTLGLGKEVRGRGIKRNEKTKDGE